MPKSVGAGMLRPRCGSFAPGNFSLAVARCERATTPACDTADSAPCADRPASRPARAAAACHAAPSGTAAACRSTRNRCRSPCLAIWSLPSATFREADFIKNFHHAPYTFVHDGLTLFGRQSDGGGRIPKSYQSGVAFFASDFSPHFKQRNCFAGLL